MSKYTTGLLLASRLLQEGGEGWVMVHKNTQLISGFETPQPRNGGLGTVIL
jgi:hypothetical protein